MLRTPLIQITADSKPLAAVIMARLMTLSITDNKKGDADELSITLDDHDNKLELPKRGVVLQCWLGYTDVGTQDMGTFTVDSVEWGGTPDTITVKAKSADMKSSLKQGRSQSYHKKTLGDIAQEVATRHSLELAIKPELASIDLGHIDQTDESDLHLLTRLCHVYGAVMSIKHGKLLIFKASENMSVSGIPLSLTTITRKTGDSFSYSVEDRQADTDNVQASYQDKNAAKKVTVDTKADGKKTKKLKGNFKDKKSATAAAHAEKDRIKEQEANFSINTAYAYPAVSTESPIELKGFKAEVDKLKWTVEKATHGYSKSGGLTTQLDLVASL